MIARTRKMLSLIGLAAVVMMLLTVKSAPAEVYKYKFGATVEYAPIWNPCGIATGSHVTGTITFDTELMDFAPKVCYQDGGCAQEFTGTGLTLMFSDVAGCQFDSTSFDGTPQSAVQDLPHDDANDFIKVYAASDMSPVNDVWTYWQNEYSSPWERIDFSFELHYSNGALFDDFSLPEAFTQLTLDPDTYHHILVQFTAFIPWDLSYQVGAIVDELQLVTPPILILNLINTTTEINAKSGILNSLDAKLDSAVKAMDDTNESNDASAVYRLQAFINAVEAQRGKHISEDEADSLVAAAEEIIDMLSMQ